MLFLITGPAAMAEIRVLAVTDSATFTPGLPQYLSLATIFCTGLTGINGVQQAAGYPLPYQIAGISVTVGGAAAPLLAVADLLSYQQINIQMPNTTVDLLDTLVVSQSGQSGQMLPPLASQWGVFFVTPSGYVVAQHLDYSLVTPDHPAQPGEILAVYGTNLGQFGFIGNQPKLGYPSPTFPLAPLLTLQAGGTTTFTYATVDGKQTGGNYIGLAPGLVGLFQVNIQVPIDAPDGDSVITAVGSRCSHVNPPVGCSLSYSLGAKIPVHSSGTVPPK